MTDEQQALFDVLTEIRDELRLIRMFAYDEIFERKEHKYTVRYRKVGSLLLEGEQSLVKGRESLVEQQAEWEAYLVERAERMAQRAAASMPPD